MRSRTTARSLALTAALASAALAVGLAGPAYAGPSSSTAAAATGVSFTAGDVKPYDYPTDTPAASFIDAGGRFWFQQSASLYGTDDPHYWEFYTGSTFDDATRSSVSDAVNPKNTMDRNNDTVWRCNTSPTGKESTYYAPDVKAGTGFGERNYCDLSGVWVDPDSGDWYGLVHNEFTPKPFGHSLHYDAIDYARSTDGGKTWKILGHAITSPFSTKRDDSAAFPNQTYYYGDGDQRLLVDTASGYFYAYYGSRVVDKDGTWGAYSEHVARSPISAKMASGSWQKFYNGSWHQPGVGGKESNLVSTDVNASGYQPASVSYNPRTKGTIAEQIAAGTLAPTSDLFVLNASWNAYLGMYIGTPETSSYGTVPLHFYGTKDLVTQQWTDLGQLPGYTQSSWYRWMVDSATATTGQILGRQFRSYCSISCSDSDGEYVNVTTSTASPAKPIDTAQYYTIGQHGHYLTQVGNGVEVGSSARNVEAVWKFADNGDGSYALVNTVSGKALGVDSTQTADRAWGTTPGLSTLASSGPSVGQQWWVQGSGKTLRLINRYSGLVLAVDSVVRTVPYRNWTNTAGGRDGDHTAPGSQTLTATVTTR